MKRAVMAEIQIRHVRKYHRCPLFIDGLSSSTSEEVLAAVSKFIMSTPAKRKAPTFSESSAQAGIKRTKPSSFPKPRNASASTSTLTSARASPAPVGGRLGASSATGNPDQDVQLFHQGIKDATGKIREYAVSPGGEDSLSLTSRLTKSSYRVIVRERSLSGLQDG